MKVIIINTLVGFEDFDKYGSDLAKKLSEIAKVHSYSSVQPDFSNVPELFDDEEKIVLYNPEVIPDGFVHFSKNLPKFKGIKYLLTPYSYYDGLDLSILKSLDIRFRNNAGANAKSVAQYALTTALMLLGKFPLLANKKTMPDGAVLGEEIGGKTAGIIGMGNIGIELMSLLQGLGVETIYFNRSNKQIKATRVDLKEIFDRDLIFLTLAAGTETREMLMDFHKWVQPHNYLIDISATDDFYDKKAMLQVLLNKNLQGYALELDNPNFFGEVPECNLITTPHLAWATLDAEERLVRNYLNRTIKILEGNLDQIDFVI